MKSLSQTQTQRDRFIETARELECDEDEGRFNETLKRIAPKTGDTEYERGRPKPPLIGDGEEEVD